MYYYIVLVRAGTHMYKQHMYSIPNQHMNNTCVTTQQLYWLYWSVPSLPDFYNFICLPNIAITILA